MNTNNNNKSNELSDEMKRLIEEKRQKAIELRQRKMKEKMSSMTPVTPMTVRPTLMTVRPTLMTVRPTSMTHFANKSPMMKNQQQQQQQRLSPYNKKSEHSISQTSTSTSTSSSSSSPMSLSMSPLNEKKIVEISFNLMNSERFIMDIGYDRNIILNIFQKFQSKNFDYSTKKWSFDIKDYRQIVFELNNLENYKLIIRDKIPESVTQELINSRHRQECQVEIGVDELKTRINSHLIDSLFQFQLKGIQFGIMNDGRCLIADEMGLGKTIQALAIVQWFSDDWPLIIVCPSSLRYQWFDAINQWLPQYNENNDILIINKGQDYITKSKITIISYDLLTKVQNFINFNTNYYKSVIFDESHYIKSDKAQRTDAALSLAKNCKRKILLSGTPALSRPIELFCQIKLLNANLFKNKHNYGMRYCDAKQKQFRHQIIWDYKGASNLDELRILLEKTVMIRRLKKDVLNELPKKRREIVHLRMELDEKEKKSLTKYKQKLNNFKLMKSRDNTVLFELFSKSAELKSSAVCQFIEDLLENQEKFVCFAHHQLMIDSISKVLDKKRVNYIRIDGQTNSLVRQELCQKFQSNNECLVALLSITAAGVGLNLTAASLVVFAEIYWNPGIIAQAEDRVHRIGQHDIVRIKYLLAKGSIDDYIWPLITKKLEVLFKAGLSKVEDLNETNAILNVGDDQQLITDFFESLQNGEIKIDFNSEF